MSGLTDNFTAEGWKAALTLSDCGELVEAERQRIVAELEKLRLAAPLEEIGDIANTVLDEAIAIVKGEKE